MEEPAPEPEPEPEPEPKVEEIKPEADEKVLEEMEEKAPSPAPVESPPNTQEPPKVKLMCLYAVYFSVVSLNQIVRGHTSLNSLNLCVTKMTVLAVTWSAQRYTY